MTRRIGYLRPLEVADPAPPVPPLLPPGRLVDVPEWGEMFVRGAGPSRLTSTPTDPPAARLDSVGRP